MDFPPSRVFVFVLAEKRLEIFPATAIQMLASYAGSIDWQKRLVRTMKFDPHTNLSPDLPKRCIDHTLRGVRLTVTPKRALHVSWPDLATIVNDFAFWTDE